MMTEKRSYTAILASLDTHISHINNHLKNIDSHLEKLNNTNFEQSIAINRNKDRIVLFYKIGGGIAVILAGLITAVVTGLIRVVG